MICPTCNSTVDSLRSIIRKDAIVNGCDNCLGTQANHGQDGIAKYNRQADYRDHAQDMVQPFEQRDYLHARGIDAAREVGASDEEIRQLY